MASESKSFEDLVKEAPPAAAAGTVSLVGMLSQSAEPGKFVLTMEDGSAVTLETAAVKGHTVLGTSMGRTIVRVDVAVLAGGVAPFALATPHQAPANILAALQGFGINFHTGFIRDKTPRDDGATGFPPFLD